MKRMLCALSCACLFSIFSGCGSGEAPPPSAEEKAKLDARMKADMEKMTLPQNPTQTQQAPAGQ